MKVSWLCICATLLAVAAYCEPIQVTLYGEPEPAEGTDYVEIVLKVIERNPELPVGLAAATKKAIQIREVALRLCGEPEKKKCQETVEVGNPQVETKYQVVRKEDVFQHFIITNEITIKVFKTQEIGPMVDVLQEMGVSKFESFIWKNKEDVGDEEAVVKQTIQRANDICGSFSYSVNRVISVQRWEPEEQEQKKGEEEQEKEEEEEEEKDIYKVQFECLPKKSNKKAKNDEL